MKQEVNIMKVDNFELIKNKVLEFESTDDFYHCMIMQRSKEVENAHIIKQYILREGDIDKLHDKIIEHCVKNNARAYINPNRKSFHDVTLKTIQELTTCVLNNEYSRVQDKFFSACGQLGTKHKKLWIVDIDTKDEEYIDEVANFINSLEPISDESKIVLRVPTKNGMHLLSTPFNIKKFSEQYKDIDVHKNTFTLLYYEGE